MDTPLLRVSRPVSACSRCRNAKVKCDGLLPACSACVRTGRTDECASSNDQFARGKERSYVASLESRIEKLEKQIAQTKQRKSSTAMLDCVAASTSPSYDSFPGVRPKPLQKEASDVDDLVADFGFMCVQ